MIPATTVVASAPAHAPGIAQPASRRDPAKTQARILKVAIAEFASKGYSGARTQTIATRAKTNIRMLYHYFGSKEALYVRVLEHVLADLRRQELQLDLDGADPLDGILQVFAFIDSHFATRPELRALLAYENLDRARHLKRATGVREMASPVIALLAVLLRRGEAAGTFGPGLDPLRLYVAMVSLAYYSRAHAPTLSRIFDTDLADPHWQDLFRRQTVRMLETFLTDARPPPHV